MCIPGGIVLGQASRFLRTVQRRVIQIEIGGPGFFASDVAGGKDDALAVGSEGDFLGPAVGKRRRVGIHASHDVHSRATRGGSDEQVRPPAVLPRIPVTHEDSVIDPTGRPGPFPLVESLFRLSGIGFGKNLHRVGDVRAVGRNKQVAHVQRFVGRLLGLAPVNRDPPHLRRPRSARQEPHDPTVRRPSRIRIGLRRGRQSARLPPGTGDQPQVRPPLIGLQVGFADHKNHMPPVRGNLHVGDPSHRQHIVD